MGQPRSWRYIIRPPLIIENTGKGAVWKRRRDAALSAGMWLVYLYWVRAALIDVGTLAAEGYAWAFLGAAKPALGAIALFGTTVLPYLAIVAANAILLISWARYNQARFRGHERHRNAVPIGPADLGALYAIETKDVGGCQAARLLAIRHAPDGTIVEIAFEENGLARVCKPATAAAVNGSEAKSPAAALINSPS
ncbi:MAG: poly-beta-1,6-N-acetyl-D-glucosamine biosynthesis protein PgaD [Rhodospirillales bacterium]